MTQKNNMEYLILTISLALIVFIAKDLHAHKQKKEN